MTVTEIDLLFDRLSVLVKLAKAAAREDDGILRYDFIPALITAGAILQLTNEVTRLANITDAIADDVSEL